MRNILIALLVLNAAGAFSQTDSSLIIYTATKRVENTEYLVTVPALWQRVEKIDQSSKDEKYDFTGINLPDKVNHAPLNAVFTIKKYPTDNVAMIEDYVITEFTSYPDRVTVPGPSYKKDTMRVQSGELGNFYSCHYYRRTKGSNYTRYDFVVYSKKRKAAYVLSGIFQYIDHSYKTEINYKLREYMEKVFKTLVLR